MGEAPAGATSAPLRVDLGRPETFNALEGKAAGGVLLRHRIPLAEFSDQPDGAYVWVVREAGGGLNYELQRD